MIEIVPDKEKLIFYLAYQARVTVPMDANAIHRALVSSAPGAEEKAKRVVRIDSPNGGGRMLEFALGDRDTPAPIASDDLHATRDRIGAAILSESGALRGDWVDIIRAMTV